MGKSELLILAAAIVVFSMFTLSLTEMQLNVTQRNVEEKIEYYMVNEAKSFLEKLEIQKFDHILNDDNSVPVGVTVPDDFTPYDSLHLEPGDTTGIFDIDDFAGIHNDLSITINDSTYWQNYRIKCDVNYVDANLDTVHQTTLRKKVDIEITSAYLDNTLRFSRVFTFY